MSVWSRPRPSFSISDELTMEAPSLFCSGRDGRLLGPGRRGHLPVSRRPRPLGGLARTCVASSRPPPLPPTCRGCPCGPVPAGPTAVGPTQPGATLRMVGPGRGPRPDGDEPKVEDALNYGIAIDCIISAA